MSQNIKSKAQESDRKVCWKAIKELVQKILLRKTLPFLFKSLLTTKV